MHFRNKILTGIAALALASGAGAALAGLPANAASTTCGNKCYTLVAEQWGLHAGSAIPNGVPHAGQPVVLSGTGPYAWEDFRPIDQGKVSFWYGKGILGPAVGRTWPTLEAWEYEYMPYGNVTDLCLGTAFGSILSAPVTLQPCASSARVLWIPLTADSLSLGGYDPIVNGTDLAVNDPSVLTAGGVGHILRTQPLAVVRGEFEPAQMWTAWQGVL